MLLCFWGKCTCPDTQPCQEHHGNHCGLWNGIQINQPNQVVDRLTRDAEAAIVRMTQDEATIDARIVSLEQKKADLERQKQEMEAAFDGANTRAKRRAAIVLGRQAETQYVQMQQEAVAISDQMNALTTGWQTASGRMSVSLIIPYTDPNGYCNCYTGKQGQLAAVNTQITTATSQWNTYNNEMNTYRRNLWNIVRAPITLIAGLGVWAYIWLGLGAALLKAAFVILLVVMILVYAFILRLLYVMKQMAKLAKQILGFQLIYYRIQSVGTCIQIQGDPPSSGSDWWQQLILEQLTPGVLPDESTSESEEDE